MRHPDAIFVQLTTGCNAKCVSCPHSFTYGNAVHKPGNMSRETWDLLLSQIKGAGYRGQVGLYLHHEPLLVKDLGAKIKEVYRRTSAYVVLSTNGALLTPAWRRELIEAQPHTVHVNISSADPDQYRQIMKLDWETTKTNTIAFILESRGRINVEINCPVLPGVDTDRLRSTFPGVKVNVEYWANSRGGLLDGVSAQGKGSRFKLGGHCMQPTQNMNVLWDGSVIACCIDWNHESRADFPRIQQQNLFETYASGVMEALRREFRDGNYKRYAMCDACSLEMGFDRKN